MRLADPAAQMRRDVQDLHSAATAGDLAIDPAGRGNVRIDGHKPS